MPFRWIHRQCTVNGGKFEKQNWAPSELLPSCRLKLLNPSFWIWVCYMPSSKKSTTFLLITFRHIFKLQIYYGKFSDKIHLATNILTCIKLNFYKPPHLHSQGLTHLKSYTARLTSAEIRNTDLKKTVTHMKIVKLVIYIQNSERLVWFLR